MTRRGGEIALLKEHNTAEELLLGEYPTEVKVGGNRRVQGYMLCNVGHYSETCRDQQNGRSSMRTISLYFGL